MLGALVRFVAARRFLFGLGVARLVSLTPAGGRVGLVSAGRGDKPLGFDGYVRVSDVSGRGGESYRSPGDQRVIIERLAGSSG